MKKEPNLYLFIVQHQHQSVLPSQEPSFYNKDYFVVEHALDPAEEKLKKVIEPASTIQSGRKITFPHLGKLEDTIRNLKENGQFVLELTNQTNMQRP